MPEKLKFVIAASVLAVLLYGCGPGFPIMTRAQEEHLAGIEAMKHDTADLKKRVSTIEAGGGLEEINFSMAETNNRIETLRREFTFVQGAVEAADHNKAQTREDLAAVSSSVGIIDSRLAELEKAAERSLESFTAFDEKLAAERADREIATGASGATLDKTVASIERRMVSIEKRLAGVETALTTKKTAVPAEDPESMYRRGFQLVKDKDYAGGEEVLEGFLARYPSHKFADHAQYWLAEVHYARGDWAKAILEFDKVIKNYPNGDKVAAATLKQGFSFDKLGSTKEARVLLQAVIDRFPSSKEAGLAAKRLESLK